MNPFVHSLKSFRRVDVSAGEVDAGGAFPIIEVQIGIEPSDYVSKIIPGSTTRQHAIATGARLESASLPSEFSEDDGDGGYSRTEREEFMFALQRVDGKWDLFGCTCDKEDGYAGCMGFSSYKLRIGRQGGSVSLIGESESPGESGQGLTRENVEKVLNQYSEHVFATLRERAEKPAREAAERAICAARSKAFFG